MAWDGVVSGELTFPRGGVAAWKKARIDSTRVDWPAWIRPRHLEGHSVATTLQVLTAWNASWRKELHGGEIVDARVGSTDVTLRGYNTCWWFPWAAGRLAAVAAMGAAHRARGEVHFVDVASGRGHVLTLDGKGGVSLAAWHGTQPDHVLDTHAWLESTGLSIPVPGTKSEARARAVLDAEMPDGCALGPSFPFAAAHRRAGASLDEETGEIGPHARGTAAEIAETRAAVGLFDLSQHALVSMLPKPGLALLGETQALAALDDGAVRAWDLRARDGTLVDAVHVIRCGNLLLLGSPGAALPMHGWLEAEARGAELSLSAHPDPLGGALETDVNGGRVAWLGPTAVAHARARLGLDVAAWPIDTVGAAPATACDGIVVRTRMHGLDAVMVLNASPLRLRPIVEADAALLCGSEAERQLAAAAGLERRAPPRLNAPELGTA